MNAFRVFKRFQANYKCGDKASIIKQITETDIKTFAQLSGDYNPIHLQNETPVVHGALLNALVSAVIGTKLPGAGTLVVSQNLNFPSKCFVNEVVTVSVELMEVRKIITARFICEVEAINKIVLYGDAKLIVPKII